MSNNNQLVISVKRLKDMYLIDQNVDDKYIIPLIKKCQDMMIKRMIDKDYFNEVLEQLSTSTLTDLNKELLDNYVEPAIAYYVMSEIFYSTEFKIKNIGTEDSNFSEIVSIAEKYLNDAKAYLYDMEWFMKDNNITFNCRYHSFKNKFI